MAAHAKAKAKAESSTDTDTETCIKANSGADISTDTDMGQMVGDRPTMEPKETGQPSLSPDHRLDLGRQMPNPKVIPQRTTLQ